MTYSIIGSGNIGSAVARQFARKGMDVAIANTRGPDSLAALRKELGHHIIPQALEAALRADTVFLAAPFSAVSVIARAGSAWMGKIVIDATKRSTRASEPGEAGGCALRPASRLLFQSRPALMCCSSPSTSASNVTRQRGLLRRSWCIVIQVSKGRATCLGRIRTIASSR